jgi:hypothetical protein
MRSKSLLEKVCNGKKEKGIIIIFVVATMSAGSSSIMPLWDQVCPIYLLSPSIFYSPNIAAKL